VPVVRSQHLGDAVSTSTEETVFFTAGDTGVTVVKGLTLATATPLEELPPAAAIYCQFSGGNHVLLAVATNFGQGTEAGGIVWVVLPPGSTLSLQGDGVSTYTATADGAVLQY